MTSNKPYLIRALYDWICDNHYTPHLLVDTSVEELNVPLEYVEDNRIVLNISPSAVRDLDLSNDFINFKARFSGQSMNIYFPASAVLAIYAKENGRGMIFPEEEDQQEVANNNVDAPVAQEDETDTEKQKKNRSHLKVIK